jgi:hypothetical protein
MKAEVPRANASDPTAKLSGATDEEAAWLHDVIRDLAWMYPVHAHRLRIFGPNKALLPNPYREDVIVDFPHTDRDVRIANSDLRSVRFRAILRSPARFDTGWAYYFAVHDNVAVVVDYEFVFSAFMNAGRVIGGKPPSIPKDLAERMFIAASMSFY